MRTLDRAEALFGGSWLGRACVFLCMPFAICAVAFAGFLLSGADALSAAFTGVTALMFIGMACVLLPLLQLFGKKEIKPLSAGYEVFLRLLVAAMFIGLLADVLGTGYWFVTYLAGHGGRVVPAAGFVLVFAGGVLCGTTKFTYGAFGLHWAVCALVALAQASALAAIAFHPSPAGWACALAIVAGLIGAGILTLCRRGV